MPDEPQTTLTWPQRVAFVPMVAAVYFIALSFPVIIGVGVYHYVGWLCCGVPL